MPLALQGFPDAAQHIITTPIDPSGVMYQVRMTWSERLDAWYVDLLDASGKALITGRRMSAGWLPWDGVTLEGLPAGTVLIRGVDDYGRYDLGDTVRLVSFSADDIPVVDDGPSIGVA